MNQKYLRRLVKAMYAVSDFPALDEYGSKIFGRPVKGTWKLYRHIARTAVAYVWQWSPDKELASYPSEVTVPTFEEFATFMLHEVAHGWCYFLKGDPSLWNYSTGADEEQVCWDISKLVSDILHVSYKKDLADLSYQFHCLAQAGDMEGVTQLLEKLPMHLRS